MVGVGLSGASGRVSGTSPTLPRGQARATWEVGRWVAHAELDRALVGGAWAHTAGVCPPPRQGLREAAGGPQPTCRLSTQGWESARVLALAVS